MAYYSGSSGSLYLNEKDADTFPDKAVAKVRGWNISQQTQTLDCTTLSDTDRVYEPGLRSYNGSANFFYYPVTGKSSFASIIDSQFETGSDKPEIIQLELRVATSSSDTTTGATGTDDITTLK